MRVRTDSSCRTGHFVHRAEGPSRQQPSASAREKNAERENGGQDQKKPATGPVHVFKGHSDPDDVGDAAGRQYRKKEHPHRISVADANRLEGGCPAQRSLESFGSKGQIVRTGGGRARFAPCPRIEKLQVPVHRRETEESTEELIDIGRPGRSPAREGPLRHDFGNAAQGYVHVARKAVGQQSVGSGCQKKERHGEKACVPGGQPGSNRPDPHGHSTFKT